ncbi:MAG: hypothetical protein JRF63_06455 [Deltaproteobacteria bacterium]|nr:hypothetical protein [Deltaproteobacteria bacterium]
MTKSLLGGLFFTAVMLAGTAAGSDDEWSSESPEHETLRAIERVVGNPDPGALQRLAAAAPPPQLIAAIYRGDRTQRLTALEACGHLNDPWPVLPYLAAVMSAPERQAASRATKALLDDLLRESSSPARATDLVPGQAAQLVEQLASIAADEHLDPDIRASALAAIANVQSIDGAPHPLEAQLLVDPEAAVRAGVLALLTPPLEESWLQPVAKMATGDDDRVLRGQAAGLLCENALSHGVTAPSPDLRKLLSTVVANPASPPEGIAPVLGCLARFSPASRADLVDAALRHQSPEVSSYWEELIGKSP